MSDCAKTRTRKTTMPFYCRQFRGHEGKCSPYTLPPSGKWLDPHWDWEQDRKDREAAARLLTRIPGYNDPDRDPFADIDEWKEAS